MLKRKGFETIDISRKDLSTRSEIKKATDHYFKNRSGIILPNTYKSKDNNCGGCGRHMLKLKTTTYLNEEFCTDCVEKWKAGY